MIVSGGVSASEAVLPTLVPEPEVMSLLPGVKQTA